MFKLLPNLVNWKVRPDWGTQAFVDLSTFNTKMDGSKSVDNPSEMSQEPNSQGKNNSPLYDWTLGMLSRLSPFKNEAAAEKESDSHAASPIVMQNSPTSLPSGREDEVDSKNEDARDPGVKTCDSDSESEPEDRNAKTFVTELSHARKSKSVELLRPPPTYITSRFKHPAKSRAIKFDLVAVWLDAACEGDLEEMRRLLAEDHAQVDICNEKGVTAMHRASSFGQTSVMSFLIDNGANINALDVDCWTPLHYACSVGSLQAVKLLLQHEAAVEVHSVASDLPSDLTEIPEILRLLCAVITSKYQSDSVVALYDFNSSVYAEWEDCDLAFEKGDKIKILDRVEEGWWLAEREGVQGYIPKTLVQ